MENKEITDDILENMGKCAYRQCIDCPLYNIKVKGDKACFDIVLNALKSERAKRAKNPGVWDGAPEWATASFVTWFSDDRVLAKESVTHSRSLPKAKAREIAEKTVKEWDAKLSTLTDAIESAILEAQKE